MSMKVFVRVCSLFIIVGFIASCYLMTTVNPKPIVTTDKEIGREREFVFDLENLPHIDKDAVYGLEKATTSTESAAPLPYLFRKNNPNLRSTQKGSYRRTVYPPNHISLYAHLHSHTNPMMPQMPPLSNTALPCTCHHVSKQSQVTESPKNNTCNSTHDAKINHPVKGRRRSIDSLQKRFDEISGSVLLKIVDEHGKSRIEIKVNTDEARTFGKMNSSVDNNSRLADDTPQNMLISLDELPDRTEIRILPNASLVVSDVSPEFDSKLDNSTESSTPKAQTKQENAKRTAKYVSKRHNDTLAVISRPGSNIPTVAMTVALNHTNHDIQRTTKTVEQLLKATRTDLALKVHFDNVTRSFDKET